MRRLLAAIAVWGALALGAGRAAQAEPPAAKEQPAAKFGDGVQSKRVPIQAPKDRPAKGAPYNWTQMAYATVLMLLMLGGLIYIVRRSTRDRRS
ncbi:MAG TPA: hypothetical protein VMZ28_22905 [Kofleriaceae bacterium]|nr:hypothetical protein [Kofleriaceae bacterium]